MTADSHTTVAGRPVARRRHQLLQGQRLARPGREPRRIPGQGGPGHGHRPAPATQLGDARRGEAVGVTELEADEVGASLKWATAKVERATDRGTGDRTQGQQRQTERAATSTTCHHSEHPFTAVSALGLGWGRWRVSPVPATA
jgi:hypothetical protein